MSDDGVGRGLFVGFLLGSVAGSVIALLYAPKTGKELRGDIRERSDDFLKDTENYIEQARSRANDLINEGKKKSEKMVADAKVKVDELLGEAEDVLEKAKEKTGDYVQDGKSKIEKKGDKLKSAVKAGLDSYKNEKEQGKTGKA